MFKNPSFFVYFCNFCYAPNRIQSMINFIIIIICYEVEVHKIYVKTTICFIILNNSFSPGVSHGQFLNETSQNFFFHPSRPISQVWLRKKFFFFFLKNLKTKWWSSKNRMVWIFSKNIDCAFKTLSPKSSFLPVSLWINLRLILPK